MISVSCINIFTDCKKDFTLSQDFLTIPHLITPGMNIDIEKVGSLNNY
jgi:hypothetical protein